MGPHSSGDNPFMAAYAYLSAVSKSARLPRGPFRLLAAASGVNGVLLSSTSTRRRRPCCIRGGGVGAPEERNKKLTQRPKLNLEGWFQTPIGDGPRGRGEDLSSAHHASPLQTIWPWTILQLRQAGRRRTRAGGRVPSPGGDKFTWRPFGSSRGPSGPTSGARAWARGTHLTHWHSGFDSVERRGGAGRRGASRQCTTYHCPAN